MGQDKNIKYQFELTAQQAAAFQAMLESSGDTDLLREITEGTFTESRCEDCDAQICGACRGGWAWW